MTNLIFTTNSEHLGKILQKKIDSKKFKIFFLDKNRDKKRYFPDGEIYVRLGKIKEIKGKIIIIHSGMPRANDSFLELKMTLNILRNNNLKNIEVFFTYFAFGMQDCIKDIGEGNVAENIIKELINYYKIKKIYTIDAHFWGRNWVNNYKIKNFRTIDLLKEKALENELDYVFLTPDLGAQRRTGLLGSSKKRNNSYDLDIDFSDDLKKLVKNKNIAVVDDLLETGGTLIRFYEKCKKLGAKKIIALITHGVLESGIKKIKNNFDFLYLTNTINQRESNVCISDFILNKL